MKNRKSWPGPLAKKIILQAKRFCATTTVDSDFVPSPLKRGNGVWLYDADGNKFLDFCAGVGVSNCGHGNREIEKAITGHLRRTGRLQYIHTDFYNPEAVKLSGVLAQMVKRALKSEREYKVFLCNSGTEANEAGIKLSFAARPKRKKIIAFRNGFHGRTLGALPTLWKEVCRRDYPMAYEVVWLNFPRAGFPDYIAYFLRELEDLEKSAGDCNAVIIEMVQGQGGIYVADKEAVEVLSKFCHRHDILIHIDEVQTGCGRTGRFLATEYYSGFQPDIITLAKGVANGFPLGATVFRGDLDWKELGRHSNTFGGNALGAATALATLDYLKEHQLSEYAFVIGKIVDWELKELSRKYAPRVANPRGLGLIRAVDFLDANGNPDKALRHRIIQEGYRLGLILVDAGDAAIRIMPPLVITIKELGKGLRLFDQAIENALKGEKK